MPDPFFSAAPFFFFRAPMAPVKSCLPYLESSSWVDDLFNRISEDDQFRESILVASPGLYEAIKKESSKDREKIANTLLYYAVRMATRATPFGLFSFVATGAWSEKTHISFKDSDFVKRTRPDMEWIWALIQKNAQMNLEHSDFKVRTNPLVLLKGDRFTLNYFRYGEKNEFSNQVISLRATPLSAAILNHAKKPHGVKEIILSLKQTLPELVEEKVFQVILKLYEQQFLLPATLPSLLNLSLKELPFDGLADLLQEIKEYDSLPIGRGEMVHRNLEKKMKKIAEASSYLQTDVAYKDAPFTVSSEVLKEATVSLDFLWRLSSNLSPKSTLKGYHALFIERFGISRTVPLLELLNENVGLGPLENNPLLSDFKHPESSFEIVWKKWLSSRLQECLYKREKEIVLDETLLNHLLKLAHKSEFDGVETPPSCDVFCKIHALTQEEIDHGNFDLVITSISSEGGSAIGRFLDILGETAVEDIRTFFETEENSAKNTRFIELSYWPKQARSANVAIQPCLRKHVLDLEEINKTPSSIALEDIYVGANYQHLYLTDKKGEYEYVTRVGNLLNYARGPEPFRFLREVTLQRYKFFLPIFWGKEFEHSTYLPSIRFNKTILSEAIWKLEAIFYLGKSKEESLKKFNEWAESWNLPQYLFLTQGDNKLLINRKHPASLKKIVTCLTKGEDIQFTEAVASAWAKGEHGYHNAELVIPFVRNATTLPEKSLFSPQSFQPTAFKERWHLFGGEWLYFKLYLEKENLESFLVDHLSFFLKRFNAPWFFVRYSDPTSHLRVRISTSSTDFALILSNFEKAANYWMEEGFIKNFMLCNHEREIERYGGVELIDCIEKLFCSDSLSVLHLLSSLPKKSAKFPSCVSNALSVIYFLRGFGLSSEKIVALLAKNIKDKKNLQGYREHKTLLHTLLAEPTPPLPEFSLFDQAEFFSKAAKHEFLKKAEHLTDDAFCKVLDSLLHMHCNRLMGNNHEEAQARHYAYKVLMERERHDSNSKRVLFESTESIPVGMTPV